MWTLENETPFQAERAFLRDVDGAEVWVVVVRATFHVRPDGRVEPAEEQVPVALAPEFLGEPGRSTLRWDTDLVLRKPTTDVIALAQAYAPGGRATAEVAVSLSVGPVHKELRVLGDRRYLRGEGGLELTAPEPFEAMPILWERARGGAEPGQDGAPPALEPRNPIGRGFAHDEERLIEGLAPNVLYPKKAEEEGDGAPAGFCAVPRDWEPRLSHAGTYDDDWSATRAPRFPVDFDERFFLSAPADQQPRWHLRGGERVELRNLTPSGALCFDLPALEVSFRTELGREVVHHRGTLQTVILEPDASRLQMIFHTDLRCHNRIHELRRTVAFALEAIESDDDVTRRLVPGEQGL